LALTMGEPAGVAGEITLKAWRGMAQNGPPFVVIADPDWLSSTARRLAIGAPITEVWQPEDAQEVFPAALPVLVQKLGAAPAPGQPDQRNATAVITSIDRAVELALAGRVRAIVTNPIHKPTLYAAGFPAPGHTEYLAKLCGAAIEPTMLLVSESLRVAPVTIHVALREAIERLGVEAIVRCATALHRSLHDDFGIDRPRLAVAGVNPHAGEGGALGDEEQTIIAPAVARLKAAGIEVAGPLAADAMFHDAARARYDGAVCMYHDQALIPIKTMAFSSAVNMTLGLPIVRTSPDHGTAFDIAGQGVADPSSLIAALRLADHVARRRAIAATTV
jgi:4-hydroxythreonine-4-phosphate dehydrogenase